MSFETILKTIITAFAGTISYITGNISQLAVVLVFFMLFDYITGWIGAYYSGTLSTKEAVKGVIKKFCFMILVLMGYCLDIVIANFSGLAGIPLSTKGAFGLITVCWLISVEGLSIVQNLDEIGVTFPKWMRPLFQKIKDSTENVGGGQDGN